MTALAIAIAGAIAAVCLSLLTVLPGDHPPPVRPAPEWAGTVEPGNTPDDRVDPEYQRQTQRACMRNYKRGKR